MGAIVLADPGIEHRAGGTRRYALPVLLVAGWVALFAYSAAYLSEDLPFRPEAADAGRSAEAAQPEIAPRRVVVLEAPEAPKATAGEPVRDAPPPAASAQTGSVAPPATAQPRPSANVASADYVGVWGPTAYACGARSRRRGYIPATITTDHAKAGRTLCNFRDGHRAGNAWVMAAECSDRGRRWSSQVRLVVDGDRLTWSSSRGTSAYIRCGRRAG